MHQDLALVVRQDDVCYSSGAAEAVDQGADDRHVRVEEDHMHDVRPEVHARMEVHG